MNGLVRRHRRDDRAGAVRAGVPAGTKGQARTPTRPGAFPGRAPDGVADHVPRPAGLPYGSAPSRAATRESAPADRGRDVRTRVGTGGRPRPATALGRLPRCCCGGRRTHRRVPPSWCSPAGAGGGPGRCCGRSGLKDPGRSSKSPLSEVLSWPSATRSPAGLWALGMSFCLSFHLPLLGLSGAHWLDCQPDLSCEDSTGQHQVDGWPLSCKQQVPGSSPGASSTTRSSAT
jgi:hypothetical protein